MKAIAIDRRFFWLNRKYSAGLITGLKRLNDAGYKLYCEDRDETALAALSAVLAVEGIEIEPFGAGYPEETIYLGVSKPELSYLSQILLDRRTKRNFIEAVDTILAPARRCTFERLTNETEIWIELNLDGRGTGKISTGIGFFNHMLEQLVKHSNIDLKLTVKGDLHIDEHHTVEDVGIALGEAINKALGNRKGINRYGFHLPMDDALAECEIDLGGRAFLAFKCKFLRQNIGEFPTELIKEFFRGLSMGLRANIHMAAKGENDHHMAEALFKSFAKAFNYALQMDPRNKGTLPTTKGII